MPTANREYKDRLFTFIFGAVDHLDWTLSLYNAVNGTNHNDPSEVTITTILDVLYLGMHNDVSFLIGDEMSLYEQQSTYNPNMPLRMLQYASAVYERRLEEQGHSKYGRTLVLLPAPRLVVLYNGSDPLCEETTLHLSDAFPAGSISDIEVSVRMININKGMSQGLLDACEPLQEYVWTVERIRENMGTMDRLRAIDDALENMPGDFVIRPYLLAHKAEVRDMLLTEYDEAKEMELIRREGERKGIVETCQSLGATQLQAREHLERALGVSSREAQAIVETYWK